ncbi:hypothetical protein MATL_G00137900 [Megalops atlanticus]|uniref:La-related protein 6 n=1 Tax=Megalops atlanticus TaxID=7932 RepID=A0A9D3TAI5_MEGAT|nr:hypothetical protein MATL_G00137900 [Megalops atlanticus]
MYAIINAFLRCLCFLLPPSWLQHGFCLWVGDECGKTAWPNPRARFKGTKPLTDQEVRTQDASTSSTSLTPSCVSLAASPSPPQGSPWGTIWELWQAVERNFRVPFTIQQRRCQRRRFLYAPYPVASDSSAARKRNSEETATVVESELGVIGSGEREIKLETRAFVPGSMSATTELPSSDEPVSDSAGPAAGGSVVDRQVPEMGTQVTITVAIQAAEDEEPLEVLPSNHLDFHGGSCSEDDIGRQEKSSGAGTSGGELEEESWQPPDPELTQKLVAQIEYYLSDENLERDAFLLKHVRRNKMGFVSVKLLTSFKKVKHLTRDWRTTAYALRQSTLLELNEEGRKVRRRTLVPVFPSESQPSRVLLLSDLRHWPELGVVLKGGAGDTGAEPEGGGGAGDGSNGGGAAQQERLMELLLKAFGAYGAIASVRVLKPGKDLPPDLKRLSGRYAQLGAEECAIVEFEEVEAAIKAHEAMAGEAEGRGPRGLKVVLIGMKPPKKKVPKERPREESGMRKSRSLNCRVRELQYLGDDSACSSSETESNPTSPRLSRKSKSANKLSPTGGGATAYQQNNHLSPTKSPLASEGRLSPEAGRRWADYSSDSSLTPSGSPWVQRRRQVASQESSPVGSPMLGRKIQNADGLPPGVVRLPRGPDGTRGFHSASVGQRGVAATTQT